MNTTLFDDYDNKPISAFDSAKSEQRFFVPAGKKDQEFDIITHKKKKNKWVKSKVRGTLYRLQSPQGKEYTVNEYTDMVKQKLWNLLVKETPSYFYIKSPYNHEKTASMAISKTRLWLCKCFSTGKAVNFFTMERETRFKPYDMRINKKIFDNLNTYSPSEDYDLPF